MLLQPRALARLILTATEICDCIDTHLLLLCFCCLGLALAVNKVVIGSRCGYFYFLCFSLLLLSWLAIMNLSVMPPKVLNKDSCRGCGSNDHKTACCPNRPCPCCSNHHRRGILDCPVNKARQQAQGCSCRYKGGKDSKASASACCQHGCFLSLQPFSVEIKNRSMFTDGNWASEAVSICPRCNKPEPKKWLLVYEVQVNISC